VTSRVSSESKRLLERSEPDFRTLLREAEPRDFPLKKAWRSLIRAARQYKRESGEGLQYSSLAQIERALSSIPVEPNLAATIKPLLKRLYTEDPCLPTAVEVDRRLRKGLPQVLRSNLEVMVTGWPDGFEPKLQALLLRRPVPPPYELAPEEVAALVREFDGRVIAGKRLSVHCEVPRGWILPPVPRNLRSRPQPRGRRGPWLPHWDEEGKRLLTPEVLAMRTAAEMRERGITSVIDGCAGLGGNSIAFVRAGLKVIAVDVDPHRLELARRNAQELRCADRIEWRCGRIEELIEVLPESPLFLDPPWERENSGLPSWIPLPPDRPVVIKAPTEFDPEILPLGGWKTQFEFGEREDDCSVLKMLTLWRL
jgi:hypothetical protein